MAKLIGMCKDMPYYAYNEQPEDYDFELHMAAQDEAMEKLEEASDRAMSSGSVIGFILSFQVADGYANYRVVKGSPLQLELIPYGDAYQIPVAHVRGITLADVRTQMVRKAALNKIFGKKAV